VGLFVVEEEAAIQAIEDLVFFVTEDVCAATADQVAWPAGFCGAVRAAQARQVTSCWQMCSVHNNKPFMV
jgi:hypothetical protein